mgnify:CR=1 FL=1
MQQTAALSAGVFAGSSLFAQESTSANERVRFACIGIGGKGDSDSADAGKHGDVVAIVDIDNARLNNSGEKKFPKAKRFTDYRKMYDEMEKSFDAVTVSTPDHSHFLATAMALQRGKACFTQKPLTHSVYLSLIHI